MDLYYPKTFWCKRTGYPSQYPKKQQNPVSPKKDEVCVGVHKPVWSRSDYLARELERLSQGQSARRWQAKADEWLYVAGLSLGRSGIATGEAQ